MPSKGSRTYKYVGDKQTGESRPESNIIMEKKLGRKLKKGEQVDHKDGDEKNNDPSNLRVLPAKKNEQLGGKHGGEAPKKPRTKGKK